MSRHRGIQLASGMDIASESARENRIEGAGKQHVRQLPMAIGTRTPITKHAAECCRDLSHVVQRHQHHECAMLIE